MNYAQTYLLANMNAFPAERIPMIQKELEELDEQGMNVLMMTEIKNPTTALILAIFAGSLGIDRFYIGNKELGIAKLALSVVGFFTLFFLIGIFLWIAVAIWQLVDIFLIMDACKQANFERFIHAINQVKLMQTSTKKTEETPSQVTEAVLVEEVVEQAPTESAPVLEGELVEESVTAETNETHSQEGSELASELGN